MPKLNLTIHTLITEYDGVFRAEVLRYPQLNCVDSSADWVHVGVLRQASKAYAYAGSNMIHKLSVPEAPQRTSTEIEIDAPHQAIGWNRPVTLCVDYVHWAYSDGRKVARAPTFEIDVVAEKDQDLTEILHEEVDKALMRSKAKRSLATLQKLSRCRLVEIRSDVIEVELDSAVKVVSRLYLDSDKQAKEEVLPKVATKLEHQRVRRVFEIDETIRAIAEQVSGAVRRGVLLVGKSGCGKSAAVHELAAHPVAFKTVGLQVWESSGARIVAGMSGFGEWQERCLSIIQGVADKRVVLHLGNLVELMDVGKSNMNKQGIASFLRPYIARGELLVIVECTPEQVPLIEREDPLLLQAFTRIDMKEPTPATSIAILKQHAELEGKRNKTKVTKTAIAEIDRLHRRYTPYSAFPGRPLRFLSNFIRSLPESSRMTAPAIAKAFSHETGLPVKLLDDSIDLDLAVARDWFASRVVGQDEAVELVVDRLAWIKTELTRPGKPIGSLLFIGPTGVGKTQMAKTLAKFLFSNEKRMVRFDMSEYRDPIAVKRLIGGVHGDEGLLTAKVREQPFCVVLFDEIEKAHPLFFDILLQVMGEGRLTDSKGRTADFCSTVIIMTSNLGVKSFQRAPLSFAEPDQAVRADEHFTKEVQRFVRPELFNRIDRIVPFRPLGREVVRTICKRELDQALKRHGLRFTDSTVTMDDDVVHYLAEAGFDERYGARPLKRAIEREVLLPIADRINRYAGAAGMEVHLSCLPTGVDVEIRARDAEDRGHSSSILNLVKQLQTLRRNGGRLAACSPYRNLANEVFIAEQLTKRQYKHKGAKPNAALAEELRKQERNKRLQRLKETIRTATAFFEETHHLEDAVLEGFFHGDTLNEGEIRREWRKLEKHWHDILRAVYAEKFDEPNKVWMALYCENDAVLMRFAKMYAELARRWQHRVQVFAVVQPTPKDLEELEVEMQELITLASFDLADQILDEEEPSAIIKEVPSLGKLRGSIHNRKLFGIVLYLTDKQAAVRFVPESGVHVLLEQTPVRCLIEASAASFAGYDIPDGVDRRGFIPDVPPVRTYDLNRSTVTEERLKKTHIWRQDKTLDLLEEMMSNAMTKAAMKILDE